MDKFDTLKYDKKRKIRGQRKLKSIVLSTLYCKDIVKQTAEQNIKADKRISE